MSRADVVVVGGGPNGLVAATVLANAGRRVVVVERRKILGGVAASEEFHPGYRTAGLLHDASSFAHEVVADLGLASHGLELDAEPAPLLVLERSGPGLLLSRDPGAARAEIAPRSPRDADGYERFRGFLARVRPALRGVLANAPPDLFSAGIGNLAHLARRGLALRRLGRRDFGELLRIPPMCVADWLREWFASEPLVAALAGPAIWGNFVGPWSPGTAATLLRREALAGRTARRGVHAIAGALESAARASGAELRTGASIRAISIAGGRISGVTQEGDERIEARVVLATCEPRRVFLELLAQEVVPSKLGTRLRAWRAEGTAAKVHLALRRPPGFAGRLGAAIARAHVGAGADELERAFDPVKYGRCAEAPALDVLVPTAADPSLAPEGGAVVSVLVHGVPRSLRAGWTDAAREEIGDRVVQTLDSFAPGLAASVVGREVLTPLDLETRYALPGGHIDHGEQGLDQLLTRPAPECAAHATPLPGLFLGGMGSWPGGGVTGLPGWQAARAILAAWDRS